MAEKEAREGNSLSEPRDLRESLEETYDKITKRDSEEPPEPEEPDETEEDSEQEEDNSEEEKESEDSVEGEDSLESEEGDSGEEEEIELPEHLPGEIREDIKSLDGEKRERFLGHIKTLEKGANEKFQEAAEARKFREDFEPVLEPVKPYLKQMGVTPEQYVANIIKVESALRSNPAATIATLIDAARQTNPGIEKQLQSVLGLKQDQEDNYVDPETKALNDKIAQLERNLSSFQQQGQQAQVSEVQRQIDAFASEKDENGELKHPHFEKVRETMGYLANANPNASLEELYQQAVWTDDDIRKDFLEKEKQSAFKASEEERKKAVQKAKAASRNPQTTKKPSKSERAVPKKRREHLSQILNQLERKKERI